MRFVSSRFARFALTASLALFGLSFTAHAATLAGISVSVINSSQLSGSLSIDLLNGTQSGSFTFFDGTTQYSFTLADEVDSDGQGASPDGYAFLDFVDASGNELWLAPLQRD